MTKLVIDIPDRVYSYIQEEWADISPEFDSPINHVMQGIKNGTPYKERRKGKWIDYQDEGFVECPFCESTTTCEDNKDELHYCFSCGAELT